MRANPIILVSILAAACGAAPMGAVDEERVARRAGEMVLDKIEAYRAAERERAELVAEAGDGTLDGWPADEAGVERFVVSVQDAPAMGADRPLVTVVVFSDFECPFCGRVVPTIERLLDSFPDEVRFVFLHNPLPFHQNARPAHTAAIEARRQGGDAAFWQMHDLLFANRTALQRADLERYAEQLGLDPNELLAALDENRHDAVIARDQEAAARVGARGTPHFFINGRRLSGAQPYVRFEEIVDQEIGLANAALAAGVPRERLYAAVMRHALTRHVEPAPAPRAQWQGRAREVDDPNAVYNVPVGNEPSRGPADALVTVVIFSDFECPFCSRVRPTLDQIEDHYGNDVRLVFMNNPLPFHRNAMLAARAAQEAYRQRGNAGFWRIHDLLFENQRQLGRDDIETYARRARLRMGQMKRALDGNRHEALIQQQAGLARTLGATGTPSFFVNGRKITGARPFADFERLIDEELAKARQLVASGTPRAQVYQETIRNGATAPQRIQQGGGAGAAAGAGGGGAGTGAAAPNAPVYRIAVPARAPSRGPADARVTIQMFSDFQCPFCSRVGPTVDRVVREYPNDVRIVWRNYPLPFHQEAVPAAEAAMEVFEQAGDQAFWQFHGLLFQNQRALERADLEGYARQVGGIDMARFRQALDDRRHRTRVEDDMQAVRDAGARIGTPSFFINGRLLQGAQPFERFREMVDRELGR